METPTQLQTQTFFASPDSALGRVRWWTRWVVFVFWVLLGYHAAGLTELAVATVLLAIVVAPIEWWLYRWLQTRRPFITLSDQTLDAPRLQGRSKSYRWKDITNASLETTQGNWVWLILTIKNKPKPARLLLTSMHQKDQAHLLRTISHHLHRHHPTSSTMPPKLHNAVADNVAFKHELLSTMPITWALWLMVGLNVAVELLLVVWGGVDLSKPETADLLRWGANSASEVQRGEYWRLLTATFLHGGVMHLTFNMIGLISAGITLERLYGHRAFLLIYFGAALIGSGVSLHFAAQQNISVGASGAVFGVAGALMVALVRGHQTLPKAFRQEAVGLGIFMLHSLLGGFSSDKAIDNSAHIGGLLGGVLVAYWLPERIDTARFARLFTVRAWSAVVLIAAATFALVASTPTARIDHKQLISSQAIFVKAAQQFDSTMKNMVQEEKNFKDKQLPARQWEDRVKTYYIPRLQQTMHMLDQTDFPADKPQHAIVMGMRRLMTLLIELLSLPSNYLPSHMPPIPQDVARAKAINQEVAQLNQHLNALLAEVKKN